MIKIIDYNQNIKYINNSDYFIRKQYYSILYFIFSGFLILLASLRPLGFDADLNGYYEIMYNIIYQDYILIEPAFILLVKLSYYLVGEEYYQRLVVFMMATIHISILAYAIRKLSKHPIFSIFIYFFIFYPILGLTQIRFAIAVSLFLLSIPDIIQKNAKSFYIKIFIAILFHYSAIIFLFFYFLNPFKLNRKRYLTLSIFSLLFPIVNIFLVKLILYLFHYGIFPDYVNAKIYSNLVQNSDVAHFHVFNILSIFFMILNFIYLYYTKNIILNKTNIILLKIFGIGIFTYMLTSFSVVISFRMLNGISIVVVLLLGNTVHLSKHKYYIIFMLLLSILLFLNTTIRNDLFNWNTLF